MNSQELWLTIFGMGVVTYLPRLLPMMFLSKITLPKWLEIWLKYVPTSIFGALIFSEVFLQGEEINHSILNPHFLASVVAFVVAFKSRSLPGTIFAGCLSFWIIREYILS